MVHELITLIAVGFAAGAMNAIGGGGSFLALPAFIALGLPSVRANASMTVALLPGGLVAAWAYRRDLGRFDAVPFAPMLGLSALGGLLGAGLLLVTPTRAFDALLPALVLIATLAFAFGRRAGAFLQPRLHIGAAGLLAVQLVLAVYAGYFGGGVGIMMMAAWALFTTHDVRALNATRMLAVTTANTAATVLFVALGAVAWFETSVALVAGLVGGWAGARVVGRLAPRYVSLATVAIGLAIAVGLFVRAAR